MGITPTALFSLTTYSVSTASTAAADYKTAIDRNFIVTQRQGNSFAVSEQTTASLRDMTVHVSAGFLFDGVTLTEIAASDTTARAAPVNAPRIDRVVAAATSGVVSVLGGTEAATPVAPSVSTAFIPLAQIAMSVGMTRIGNSMITDERAVWGQWLPGDYQEFTSTGTSTWSKPSWASSVALVIAMVIGGGGTGSTGNGPTDPQGSGGGGGACNIGKFLAGALSSAVTVVVPAGSTQGTTASGGTAQFGTLLAYGGAAGDRFGVQGGGGGGIYSAGVWGGAGGSPTINTGSDQIFGGGAGGASGFSSVYGGGGGSDGASTQPGTGGKSMYGGGGGGASGDTTTELSTGGNSIFAGNGGDSVTVAGIPGGGGGGGSEVASTFALDGARGEVRVWTLRG